MPVPPSLSRIERERIADAARLSKGGVPVRWRAFGLRLSYTAGGREVQVFSAGSRRVFDALAAQVEQVFKEESKDGNAGNRDSLDRPADEPIRAA